MSYDAKNAYAPGSGATGPGTMDPSASIRGATSPEDLSLPLYGASSGEAVKRFFRSYATFSGRASRSEYWWSALFTGLVQIIPIAPILIGANGAVGSTASDPYAAAAPSVPSMAILVTGIILSILLFLAMVIPYLAVTWRRLHDANFAGPFYFLTLVPNVGTVILFVLLIMPSKPEGQRFDR